MLIMLIYYSALNTKTVVAVAEFPSLVKCTIVSWNRWF